MDSDDPEKTAFLSSSSDRSKTAGPDSCDTKPSSWRTPFYRLDFALHFLLIVLYTFVAVSFVRSNSSQEQCLHSPNGDDSTIAPQKASAVGSKTENAEVLGITDLIFIPIFKRFTAFQDSPFTGSPGPDSDRAWHDLLSNMSVRVSREELERGNQTSVELPDGGYMAWLGVFHELHCVKMLRQWKYRDYYHPNLTQEEEMHRDIHADHCLEMLRSASMCRADVSLTTFKWPAPTKQPTTSTNPLADQHATHRKNKPMLDSKRPLHVCVDWQALMASISHRVVSEEESMRLRNPM